MRVIRSQQAEDCQNESTDSGSPKYCWVFCAREGPLMIVEPNREMGQRRAIVGDDEKQDGENAANDGSGMESAHRPNENKMSDGGRDRAAVGVKVWKSSQKWSVQRFAVRSIAWLGDIC